MADDACPRDNFCVPQCTEVGDESYGCSSNEGGGDLPGIIEKLDYLEDLGVDAVWLSPIYKSPMADMGYDISDYRDIDPIFGSLEDFNNLIEKSVNNLYLSVIVLLMLPAVLFSQKKEEFKSIPANIPECEEEQPR